MENETPNALAEDWELLMSFFPADWQRHAQTCGALKGLRQDKSAEVCLRVLLLHLGCGFSLRETIVRAQQAGLADLSDVALLKRLRKSKAWLRQLEQDPDNPFPGKGKMRPEEAELFRLKRELMKVTAERDILKKALAYFAKEPQ